MKTFDLMFCCLGNGITVCDRNREEHGDYKNVAHIAAWGGLRIYDPYLKCDLTAMERIWAMSKESQADFCAWWFRQTYMTQYKAWYESLTISQKIDSRESFPEEKPSEWLLQEYIANCCRRSGYEMPPA